jgi:hypothetical protein
MVLKEADCFPRRVGFFYVSTLAQAVKESKRKALNQWLG